MLLARGQSRLSVKLITLLSQVPRLGMCGTVAAVPRASLLTQQRFFSLSLSLSLSLCIAVLHTLVAGLLARSPHPEGPATDYLDTGFSWFPCV